MQVYKFNVYSLKWAFVEELFASTDWGIKKVGDYIRDNKGYTKSVFIKRIA